MHDDGLEILTHSESVFDPQILAFFDVRYEIYFGNIEIGKEKIQELVELELFQFYTEFLAL